MKSPCLLIKKEIGALFTCSEFRDFVRISTPFLYPDRDIVEIYYKQIQDGFVLTDFGETIRWIQSRSSTGMINEKQEKILEKICKSNHLIFNGEMIIGKFDSKSNLSNNIMRFCQSITDISGLWVLQPGRNIKNIIDVVEEFIKGLGINYERSQKYTGSIMEKNWYPHFFTISQGNPILTHVLNVEKKSDTKASISTVNAQWEDLESYKSTNGYNFISLIIDTNNKDNRTIWTSGDERFLKRTSIVQKWSNKEALKRVLMTGSID